MREEGIDTVMHFAAQSHVGKCICKLIHQDSYTLKTIHLEIRYDSLKRMFWERMLYLKLQKSTQLNVFYT